MSRKPRKEWSGAPQSEADPDRTLVATPRDRAAPDTASAETALRSPVTEKRPARVPTAGLASERVLESGTMVGSDYRIMDVLTVGETAIAYKAEDINLGVAVLLKEFAPTPFVERTADQTLAVREGIAREDYEAARERFVREAQTLVRFRHPNIIRAHRALRANGTAYIVLDYDEGETLETWLAELGRLPTQKEVDRILSPLLGALESVHAAGYVHGDLNPGNVLMRRSGGALLVNFANCRRIEPENDEPSSDIYSFAAMLYRAVTGKDWPDGAGDSGRAASGDYRPEFLEAMDRALSAAVADRPQSIGAWEGIRPPEDPAPDPDPPPSVLSESRPTMARDQSKETQKRTQGSNSVSSGAPTQVLSQLATQVLSALPEIKEETDIPPHDFERWLLPAAIVTGCLGALFFATGSFPLAAVFQVAATAMFFLRGYFPLYRFLSHTTRRIDGIVRRAEQATRTAAWMIAAILVLLTVNPLFVERFVPPNSEAPLIILSMIIAVPALIMGLCGYFGTPVRRSIGSVAAGAVNIFVLIFSVLFLGAFTYTMLSTPENIAIHPAVQVNRYLYIIATLATGTLGVLIFISRLSAKQRVKQAAMIA